MQEAAADADASAQLVPVSRSVITLLIPLAETRSVDLGVVGDVDIDVPIRNFELSLLLRNRIENSLYHGRRGGKVDVVVSQLGGLTQIEVRDDGPGIPVSERNAVLQPFHRLNSDADGSGLGLAIVKAIVDRCHATIAIGDASPGASVVVAFPVGTSLTSATGLARKR